MEKKYRTKAPAWLLFLLFAYAAFLAALTVVNSLGADRWWLGAFNLYLPQVIWAIPGILLFFLTVRRARFWFWLPLLCVFWVFGPVMGLAWHLPLKPATVSGELLRVMTCNAKYGLHGKSGERELIDDIRRNTPDLILLQDAVGASSGLLGAYLEKWNVRSMGQYLVASRFPLDELQVLRLSPRGDICVRTRLKVAGTVITLYNVHLESPRHGLNALRVVRKKPWYLPGAVQQLENNVEERFIQAVALRDYLRQEKGPVIVAGDLNSPDSSRVCAALREIGLYDAFARSGSGYGYTYGHFLLRRRLPGADFSWMRIDHIMVSDRFKPQASWTGTGRASDHRPVFADLVLEKR